MQDDTTVHLELCLARATQSHGALTATTAGATTLSLEVCPQTLKTWQHVAMLSELDLSLGLSRLCPHSENVEDE